jgi:pimeloyl-ACP methyl ester carboxylesterase
LSDPLDPAHAGDGADLFYAVLRDEILPLVEARYRIDATRRSLVGHSKGGVFAWYAAFRHAPPEPPLFSGVVAADCGYEEPLFTMERWHAERSTSLPMRIFASRAVYNGAGQQIAFEAMLSRVRARNHEGLVLLDQQFETDHAGAVQPSFDAGLALLLSSAP